MRKFFWTIYAFFVRIANRIRRWRIAYAARFSWLAPAPKEFVSHPEPKSIGSFTRGQQMALGNFRFSGAFIEAPDKSIWDISDARHVLEEIHECAWIDDIAAIGTADGRRLLQSWVGDWVNRYGKGKGAGWQPDITGKRLIHWVSHALTIMQGQDRRYTLAFLKSVTRQARFLEKTWKFAPVGLPRIQALVGLVYIGLAFSMRGLLKQSMKRLGQECERWIGEDGSVASRSPEELMEIFVLLVWAARVLEEAEKAPDPRHLAAIERIAPTLRALRLGDGSLARFHGGGRGIEGLLDQALAESGVRPQAMRDNRMGYARVYSGRSTVIIDAAPPATGRTSDKAHASTLAFEMSAGRHPIIANTGPGRFFGAEWKRASRATACHSTLVLDDTSSATIWDEGYIGETFGERLQDIPTVVTLDRAQEVTGVWVLGSHNGFVKDYGLTHDRRMFLSPNGRELRGEDTLFVQDVAHQDIYHNRLRAQNVERWPFSIHFHLHPDAAASLDMSGHAVSIKLKSEEIWVFRQTGGEVSLRDAVFLDQQRLRPRQTKQIVVTGFVEEERAQVTWAMTRAQEGNRYTMDAALKADLEPLV